MYIYARIYIDYMLTVRNMNRHAIFKNKLCNNITCLSPNTRIHMYICIHTYTCIFYIKLRGQGYIYIIYEGSCMF